MEDILSRALIISPDDMSIFIATPISIAVWMVTTLALLGSSLPLSRWLSRATAGGA